MWKYEITKGFKKLLSSLLGYRIWELLEKRHSHSSVVNGMDRNLIPFVWSIGLEQLPSIFIHYIRSKTRCDAIRRFCRSDLYTSIKRWYSIKYLQKTKKSKRRRCFKYNGWILLVVGSLFRHPTPLIQTWSVYVGVRLDMCNFID